MAEYTFRSFTIGTVILCLILPGITGSIAAQQLPDSLAAGFLHPGESAKPRTWWHWTRGNITQQGITHDLEWMQRVGIGGFQIADVNFGAGQTVDKPIMFGTPEWLQAVEHAAKEAERLGLEMAIFSSAGWSLAGGPWVKPEQAMKKLVWSDTLVVGPQSFSGQLTLPPAVNGPIRNMARSSRPQTDPGWYGDAAVIAYPTPDEEFELRDLQPVVTVNGIVVDGTPLLDDDLNSALALAADHISKSVVIDFNYPVPVSVRAATIASREGVPVGTLSVSTDQVHFTVLASLPGPQLYRPGKVRTYAFEPKKAQHFRLEITGAPPSPAQVMGQPPPQPLSDTIRLLELQLHSGARVNRWEDQAGFSFLFEYSAVQNPDVNAAGTIDPDNIIVLTSRMSKDGHLNWEVPPGKWTILRAGYSLTGAKNRPAVPAGLGYEVDKLSAEHTLAYIRSYLEPIRDKLGTLFGERLQYLMMDSWEAGMQNWTENMAEEFRERRGYDLLPYLPVLTGHVVGSPDISDRFLWDFRRTLADMFAENFYATMSGYLHENGLKAYGEASGVSLEILEDALLCKKYMDVPMGEFWVRDLHPSEMYHVDVRGAASAAHGYGKRLVAAEAFTGGNYETPQTLKRISDYWFTQGVNRIVFHTSTHQPLDTKPGNAMVGTHIHRNITWAEQAAPLMTYLARNSFMLQQGKFVADIAYLLKEGAPSTMSFWGAGLEPAPPDGYDYDYINTDILINRMSADGEGGVVLPDGMRYRILVLPQTSTMTLRTLHKIHDLVNKGVTILGPKPETTPGLEDDPAATGEFDRLVNVLWGDLDGISRTKMYVAQGMVIWGERLDDVLKELEIAKDVEYSRGLETNISWIHRCRNNADIYFISSQSDLPESIQFSFRVSGKQPELWHPDDGGMEKTSYEMKGGRTIVPLSLEPYGSVFVVFRHTVQKQAQLVTMETGITTTEVAGPWTVQFPAGWGAPREITMKDLQSWTASTTPGIQYFSGTARYLNTVHISGDLLRPNISILLDLGLVRDLAEVYVNSARTEILWKQPYRVDITQYVKTGVNQIAIDVTNQWTNRLAGDQDLPEDQRVLSNFVRRFRGGWEPQESGLMGPVRISVRSHNED